MSESWHINVWRWAQKGQYDLLVKIKTICLEKKRIDDIINHTYPTSVFI